MTPELKKFNDLTKEIKMVMLSTRNSKGEIHGRPMATQEMEDDGSLWFVTSDETGKVDEISADPQVNLSYAKPEGGAFVSVSGTAQVKKDRTRLEKYWNPMMKAWFPKGIDDPTIVLIQVKISSAEFWDAPQGKMIQMIGMAKAALTGKEYKANAGEHEKVNFQQ